MESCRLYCFCVWFLLLVVLEIHSYHCLCPWFLFVFVNWRIVIPSYKYTMTFSELPSKRTDGSFPVFADYWKSSYKHSCSRLFSGFPFSSLNSCEWDCWIISLVDTEIYQELLNCFSKVTFHMDEGFSRPTALRLWGSPLLVTIGAVCNALSLWM